VHNFSPAESRKEYDWALSRKCYHLLYPYDSQMVTKSKDYRKRFTIMANDITSQEYQQYMALREQINTGIENADSEFMLTTYSMLRTVMNKRQKAALQLNIQLENKAIREKKEAKREQLRKGNTSQSGTPQSGTQQRTSASSSKA
jgi:hypothetical protein